MTEHLAPPDKATAKPVIAAVPSSGLCLPGPVAERDFFENEEIGSLLKRGLFYAQTGIPIHFSGAAGQGKTSLALAIARRLGRPVALVTGHDWLTAEDMIGKEVGQSVTTVIDKYVQSVRRTEKQARHDWRDSVLATAMEQGHTLIYDEFTRSSAAVNGLLLSVLEEGVLVSTDRVNTRTYLTAHPDFRMILTSNPREYEGVNHAPDALLDRMITFRMRPLSAATESGILAARTGLDAAAARRIVALVRALRQDDSDKDISLRATIMIGRIVAARQRLAPVSDTLLAQIAADVLNGRQGALTATSISQQLRSLAP